LVAGIAREAPSGVTATCFLLFSRQNFSIVAGIAGGRVTQNQRYQTTVYARRIACTTTLDRHIDGESAGVFRAWSAYERPRKSLEARERGLEPVHNGFGAGVCRCLLANALPDCGFEWRSPATAFHSSEKAM
jgi:hypothetical protein